jgi:hypothetical protein
MTKEQKYAPGTILQDSHDNSYWLVLAPNEFYPIKFNSVANLFSGTVVHVDWIVKPKEISHLEIMW